MPLAAAVGGCGAADETGRRRLDEEGADADQCEADDDRGKIWQEKQRRRASTLEFRDIADGYRWSIRDRGGRKSRRSTRRDRSGRPRAGDGGRPSRNAA